MNDEVHRKRVLILKSIQKFQTERMGLSPTIRELAKMCDISSTYVVSYHVRWLVNNGYIIKEPKISRGIIGITEAAKNLIGTYDARSEVNDQLRRHIGIK